MKKNGRTLREDIVLIIRGLKEFSKILPGQLRKVLLRDLIIASIPFLTTTVSAYMIDGLVAEKSKLALIGACFASMATLFLLSLLKALKEAQIAVGFNRLFSCHEISLTDKSYEFPYEVLERKGTKQLRDQVTGSINLSGAGMASLYWDIDTVILNSITILAAMVITIRFFAQIFIWDYQINHTLAQSLLMVLGILSLIAICSVITCKTSNMRFDVSYKVFIIGVKYIRYGDFYTMEYLNDENAAMDARIYGQEDMIVNECRTKCHEHFAIGKEKELNAMNVCDGIKFLCSCTCGCVIYLLIGQKAMQGAIGFGSILLLYAAVTMVIDALSAIAQILTDLRNNNEHLINYFHYVDLPKQHDNTSKESADSKLKFYEITLEHVSFHYPESENMVLKDVNLKLHKGEKVAIVGENGSGKTTLIKLLCRLYEPTEGKILLNGVDVREYNYQDYIKCISTVFQDFSLFAFSLAENVASSLTYDSDKVTEALMKADFKNKLKKLPKGIEQSVYHDFDENGINLSGGEEQKIAIARAIYKDSEFMILDEPTAALDPYAEYEIYQNFGKITSDKTLISISHRLSSCRICDRIVVMNEGKLVQNGSHDLLVSNKNGKYFELWNAQAQYYN